jgi:hypothetical protein
MNLLDIFESDFARDKWNKASDEREAAANRREAEMTARHRQGKEDMSGAIDRLEKHMNTPVNEKLKGLPKKLGSSRDLGKSVRKFRAARGLEEGAMKEWLWKEAERLERNAFIANAAEYGMSDQEAAEWWDSINGVDEAGIGQDIVNRTEKMARATPPTRTGAVASTVKNAAKWLAGKGGPGREGPTYEGAEDIVDHSEYDREGDMAKDNIHTIVRNARELESVISNNDNLPEWVQDKLANIKGMMTAVSEYMQTQHEREGVVPEGTETQWSKESNWKEVPKSKSGRPADPRGEVTHLSDVARREAERKATQKKSSKEVDEGFQDFNKVEPYAVCLAGKPVKKFDYYEQARRFHDNWKQKLYREGDMAKADKITLMPLNLDEDRDPWKEKHFGPVEVIQKVFKVKADNGKSYNIKAATEQAAKETLQKHVPDANILSIKFVSNVMDEAGSPAQQAAIAIAMKKAGKKPMDEGNPNSDPWYVYAKQNPKNFKKFKTYDAAKAYADKHGLTCASAGHFHDRVSVKGPQGVEETVTDVKSGMTKIYNKLAPKIERHRDSFLAGQLYDELENYAELHGAEDEFKRMMTSARNRAHMDYDTNPGGFQNWFWYLPFAEEELNEEQDTSAVESAIIRRIMVAHKDLLMKFGPQKVMQAAEEVAYNVGDVDEIGTSDVSAYVAQVKQILGATP